MLTMMQYEVRTWLQSAWSFHWSSSFVFEMSPTGTVLRHGRDALPTWDSIAYWERGTKGSGSGF